MSIHAVATIMQPASSVREIAGDGAKRCGITTSPVLTGGICATSYLRLSLEVTYWCETTNRLGRLERRGYLRLGKPGLIIVVGLLALSPFGWQEGIFTQIDAFQDPGLDLLVSEPDFGAAHDTILVGVL